MTELKTLKDFETKLIDWKEGQGFWVNLEELRKEAIKWVKELRIRRENASKSILEFSENFAIEFIMHTENNQLIRWIKNFFNITEEDLK